VVRRTDRCPEEYGFGTGCCRLTRVIAVYLTGVSGVGFAGRAGSAAIWDRCRRLRVAGSGEVSLDARNFHAL
jgi:hypothetical protein